MPTIRNPILPGFHPDPSICRVGPDFCLVTSSFEYFPGVPLFHSTDLVNWKQIGHVLTRASQLPLQHCRPSGGIFAPTIRHHQGRFYMVTTNTRRTPGPAGNFYVWTDDIHGEWSDPVWVDMPGIDPDLFFDDNGDVWFSCTDGQQKIDIDTGELIGEPVERWPGTPGTAAPEAPHLFQKDGWIYTMLAEGGTERGHMVTIARSREVGGAYEVCPHNPILSHRSLHAELQSTGHADLVEDASGNWWMVFLATRPVGYPPYHLLGRETCLAPVAWTEDGWPVVNCGKPVPVEMNVPELPAQKSPWTIWEDDFSGPNLKPEWNFLRNPHSEGWSLTEHPGTLTLRCSSVGLDDHDSPAWVGRRLQHFDTEQRVTLEFAPQFGGEEAGLCLFLQAFTHCEVAVTKREGRRVIQARRVLGSFREESEAVPVADGPVELSILTSRDWMDLGMIGAEGRISLMRSESKFLSTEIGGRFTGLYVALYAKGSPGSLPTRSNAYFSRFSYIVR
jgi:xylan 1,4-beta-xylosidase